MIMRDFSLDTYNLYSDRQVVPSYVPYEQSNLDVSPVINRVMKKASFVTKLFSIFL